MAPPAEAPAKLSFRQKLKKSLTKSTSPQPPLPQTLSPDQDSHQHVSNPKKADSSSASGQAPAALPSANTQLAARPQLTLPKSPSGQGNGLLQLALEQLSTQDKALLSTFISQAPKDDGVAIDQVLAAAKAQQAICLEKQWSVTLAGRKVVLRERAEKVIGWIDRFKAVGDVLANVDPVHIGIPWAGVRFLLEATTADSSQMAALLGGCETALYMANRLKTFAAFLDQLPGSQVRDNLEETIVKFYSNILLFLAQAMKTYQMSTSKRSITAIWNKSNIERFEEECNALALSVHIDATSCDRTIITQSGQQIASLQDNMRIVLDELQSFHTVQASIDRLKINIDLNKFEYARGAIFNSSDSVHRLCHHATRISLLEKIKGWVRDPAGRKIFWLNGMAGTGKSTISWTISHWLDEQAERGSGPKLAASFFFQRGHGDRGNARLFFSTIARQLVTKLPGIDAVISEVIAEDPFIFNKLPAEQFKKLIFQPLQSAVPPYKNSTLVVVVDALDECQNEADIRTMLRLWPQLSELQWLDLRLFITSRPELPIQIGFNKMSLDSHVDFILQDQIPKAEVRQDLGAYLETSFAQIREDYHDEHWSEQHLSSGWPGSEAVEKLVTMSEPLFIVAATILLFVGDLTWDPEQRLGQILEYKGLGQLTQMEQAYLPVLDQITARAIDPREREQLQQEFRDIVGSVVCLFEPFSITDIAKLLKMRPELIARRLSSLRSVLQVPTDLISPVQILHLSFPEFLFGEKMRSSPFSLDDRDIHGKLMKRCLEVLSDPDGLHENMCSLTYPGQPRSTVNAGLLATQIPFHVQYSCRFWVQHLEASDLKPEDNDSVHLFLRNHFLHWLEVLSLLGRITEAFDMLKALLQRAQRDDKLNTSQLLAFLKDARRFLHANAYIVDIAPLQLYSSAIIFVPQNSLVRKICGKIPKWLERYPTSRANWNLELQKLDIGISGERTVWKAVFSPNERHLMVCSQYRPVILYDLRSGIEVQRLDNSRSSSWCSFSRDGSLLIAAKPDGAIGVWSAETNFQLREFGLSPTHNQSEYSYAFSPNDDTLAAGNWDVIHIWNITTGQITDTIDLKDPSRGQNSEAWRELDRTQSLMVDKQQSDKSLVIYDTDLGHVADETSDSSSNDSDLGLEKEDDAIDAILDGSDLGFERWNGARTEDTWHSRPNDATDNSFKPDTQSQAQALMDEDQYRNDLRARRIRSIALSSDGTLMACGGVISKYPIIRKGWVQIWELSIRGRLIVEFGEKTRVVCLAFSPDSCLLAVGLANGYVRIWDVNAQQEVKRIRHGTRITSIDFSTNGTRLSTSAHDASIRVWNLISLSTEVELRGHSDGIATVAFSPSSRLLASGSRDGTARIWETMPDLGSPQRHEFQTINFARIDKMNFSPDGLMVASTHDDGTVRLWDARTCAEIRSFVLGRSIHNVETSFSPKGTFLIIRFDKFLQLLDPHSGVKLAELEGEPKDLNSEIAFSADESVLVVSTPQGTTQVWNIQDLSNWQLVTELPTAYPDQLLTISPNGKLLASTVKWRGKGPATGLAEVWDLESRRSILRAESLFHPVAEFSPDSSMLVICAGFIVELWDIQSGTLLHRFSHGTFYEACSFSSSGCLLSIVSHDGQIHLHNLNSSSESEMRPEPGNSIIRSNLRSFSISPGKLEPRFTNGDTVLSTKKGAVSLTTKTRAEGIDELSPNDDIVYLDPWFSQRDRNLLWIPPDHRPADRPWKIDYCNNTFALASADERLTFYRFDLSKPLVYNHHLQQQTGLQPVQTKE